VAIDPWQRDKAAHRSGVVKMKALHSEGFCFCIPYVVRIRPRRYIRPPSIAGFEMATWYAGCHRTVVVLCVAFSRFAKRPFRFERIVIHEDASPLLRALPHSVGVLDGEKICQYTHSRRDDRGEAMQCKEAFAATVYLRPVSYGVMPIALLPDAGPLRRAVRARKVRAARARGARNH
jgi:hypothetical protein